MLAHLEHYVALSYLWGDAILKGSILIDGKVLGITASLEMALRYVRDGKRVLRIWADGICINQGDVHDRNMQVAFMGAIYSIARHTVIFLGEEKMEHESVLRRIAAFGAIPESNFDQDSLAKLVRDILVHPWFQRVWILQELVLSIDPWVQIGRTRMRWDVFVHCMMKYDATSRSSTQSHLETMSQIRAKYQTGKHSSANSFRGVEIFDILEARRGLGATDPKDMVYAHLGMSEPDVRSEINIDYSRSVAQIYEDISRYIYKLRQNISLLSHIEDLSSDARREGLPSWVPDWAIAWVPDQELETILEMENGESHMNLFHGVPGVLGIEGNYHGTVMDILPRECFRKSSMEEILEWLSGIESLGFMQRIFASAIQLSKGYVQSPPRPQLLIRFSQLTLIYITELWDKGPVTFNLYLATYLSPRGTLSNPKQQISRHEHYCSCASSTKFATKTSRAQGENSASSKAIRIWDSAVFQAALSKTI